MARAAVPTLDSRSTLAGQHVLSKELILSLQARRGAQSAGSCQLAGGDTWVALLTEPLPPGENKAVHLLTRHRALTTLLAQLHVLDAVHDHYALSDIIDTQALRDTCSAWDNPWQHLQHIEEQQAAKQCQPHQLLDLVLFLLNALDAHEAFSSKKACAATGSSKLSSKQKSSKAAANHNSFGTEWVLRGMQPLLPGLQAGSSIDGKVLHVGIDACLLALPYAMHLLCHAVATAKEQPVQQQQQQQVAAAQLPAGSPTAEQTGVGEQYGFSNSATSQPAPPARTCGSGDAADAATGSAGAASDITLTGQLPAAPAPDRKQQQDSAKQVLDALPAVWARCGHHLWLRPVVPGSADVPVYLPRVLHTHSVLQRWGMWAAPVWQLAPPPVLSANVWGALAWQQLQGRYLITPDDSPSVRSIYAEAMCQLQALQGRAQMAAGANSHVQQRQGVNMQATLAEEGSELSSRMLLLVDTWTNKVLSLDAFKLMVRQQELQCAPLSPHITAVHASTVSACNQSRNMFSQQELASVLELVSYITGMKAAMQKAGMWLQPLQQQASQAVLTQVATCQALHQCAAGLGSWATTANPSYTITTVLPPTALSPEVEAQADYEQISEVELAAMGPLTRAVHLQRMQQQLGSATPRVQIPHLPGTISPSLSQPGTDIGGVDITAARNTTRSGTDIAASSVSISDDDTLSSDAGMAYWKVHVRNSDAASSCLEQEASLYYPADAQHQHDVGAGSPQCALAAATPGSSSVNTPQTDGPAGTSSSAWQPKPTTTAISALPLHNVPAMSCGQEHTGLAACPSNCARVAEAATRRSPFQLQEQLSGGREPAALSSVEPQGLMTTQHVSQPGQPCTSQCGALCNNHDDGVRDGSEHHGTVNSAAQQASHQQQQQEAFQDHQLQSLQAQQLHSTSTGAQQGEPGTAAPRRGAERPCLPGNLSPGMPGFAWFDVSNGSGTPQGRPLGEGLEGWEDDGEEGQEAGEQQDTLLGLLLQPSDASASHTALQLPSQDRVEAAGGVVTTAQRQEGPSSLYAAELAPHPADAHDDDHGEQENRLSSMSNGSITAGAAALAAMLMEPPVVVEQSEGARVGPSRSPAAKQGLLRRLFAGQASEHLDPAPVAPSVTTTDKQQGRSLASFLQQAGSSKRGNLFGGRKDKQGPRLTKMPEAFSGAIEISGHAAAEAHDGQHTDMLHGTAAAAVAAVTPDQISGPCTDMEMQAARSTAVTAAGGGMPDPAAEAEAFASAAHQQWNLDDSSRMVPPVLEQLHLPPSEAELQSAALQAELAAALATTSHNAASPVSALPMQATTGKRFAALFGRAAKTSAAAPGPITWTKTKVKKAAVPELSAQDALAQTSLPVDRLESSPAISSQQPTCPTSPRNFFANIKRVSKQARGMPAPSQGIGAQHRQHMLPATALENAHDHPPTAVQHTSEANAVKAPLVLRSKALAKKLKHALLPGRKKASPEYTSSIPVAGVSIINNEAAVSTDVAAGEALVGSGDRNSRNSMVGGTMLWSAAYELESSAGLRLAMGYSGAAPSTVATSIEELPELATGPLPGEDPAPVVSVLLAAAQGTVAHPDVAVPEPDDYRVSTGLTASSDPVNLSWDPPSPSDLASALPPTAAASEGAADTASRGVACTREGQSEQDYTEDAPVHATRCMLAGNGVTGGSISAAVAGDSTMASGAEMADVDDSALSGSSTMHTSLDSNAAAGPAEGLLTSAGPSHLSPVQEQQEGPESPQDGAMDSNVSPVPTPRQSGMVSSQPSMLTRARSFFTRNLSKKSRAESEHAAAGTISAQSSMPLPPALTQSFDGGAQLGVAVAADHVHLGDMATAGESGTPRQQPGTPAASPFAATDAATPTRALSTSAVPSVPDLGRTSLLRSPSHWVRKWKSHLSSNNAAATEARTTDAGRSSTTVRQGVQMPTAARQTAEQQERPAVPARHLTVSAPARMFAAAAAAARQQVAKLHAAQAIHAGMSNVRSLAQQVLQEVGCCAGSVSYGLFTLVSLLQTEVQQLIPEVLQAHRSGLALPDSPEPLKVLHELESLQHFCATFLPAASTTLLLTDYSARVQHAGSLAGLLLQHASSGEPLHAATGQVPFTGETEEPYMNQQQVLGAQQQAGSDDAQSNIEITAHGSSGVAAAAGDMQADHSTAMPSTGDETASTGAGDPASLIGTVDEPTALARSLCMSVPLSLCHMGVEMVAAKQLPVSLAFVPLQLVSDVNDLLQLDSACGIGSSDISPAQAAATGCRDSSSSVASQQPDGEQAATDVAVDPRGSAHASLATFKSQLRSHIVSSLMSMSEALARAVWGSFLEAAQLQNQHAVPQPHPCACTAHYNDLWSSNSIKCVIGTFRIQIKPIICGALTRTIADAAEQLVAMLEGSCDILHVTLILEQYRLHDQALRLLQQHAGRLAPWEWFWRRASKAAGPSISTTGGTANTPRAAQSPAQQTISQQSQPQNAVQALQQQLDTLHTWIQNGRQQHNKPVQEDRMVSALCSNGGLQVIQSWSLDLHTMQLVHREASVPVPAGQSAGGVAVVVVEELGPLAKAAQLRAAKQQLQPGFNSVPPSPYASHIPKRVSSNGGGSVSSHDPSTLKRTASELGAPTGGNTANAQWQQQPQQPHGQPPQVSHHHCGPPSCPLQPVPGDGWQARTHVPASGHLTVHHYLALNQISHPYVLSVVAHWLQTQISALLQNSVLPVLQRIFTALSQPTSSAMMTSQPLTHCQDGSDRVRRETVEVVSPPMAPDSAAQLLSEWTKHHAAVSRADWRMCFAGLALLGNLMAAAGTLDAACLVHPVQSGVWAAAHLSLAPALEPNSFGLSPTETSLPAAIRQRVLGHNLPAMHGGVQLQACDPAHLLVDHMAMDAWQTLQPRSFAPGLLQDLRSCTMGPMLTPEQAAQGCCAAVLQMCLELAAAARLTHGPGMQAGSALIEGHHVGSALYGAAMLLHLTGCQQQLPRYNHTATILQLAQHEAACSQLLGTSRASVGGGQAIDPVTGAAQVQHTAGCVSGDGRADMPLSAFLMTAHHLLQDFETACSRAACSMQYLAHAVGAQQPGSSPPAPQLRESSCGVGTASRMAASVAPGAGMQAQGQTALPAWQQGGAEQAAGARTLDAKARAAAWGYKVDWALREAALTESLDVSASMSDTRFRDQQLDALVRECTQAQQ